MAKTKIELFEDEMITNGVTPDKLETFKKLLARAGDDYNRNQHCYLTAYQIPVDRLDEAILLINFGINTYQNDKLGMPRAYMILAQIYERAGYYKESFKLYNELSKYNNYNDPWGLLRTRIHVDDFQYSKKVKYYHDLCDKQNDFSKAFINNRFYLLIAKIILEKESGNNMRMKKYYSEAINIILPGHKGELYDVLKKHKYEERISLTNQCISFLKEIEIYLNIS